MVANRKSLKFTFSILFLLKSTLSFGKSQVKLLYNFFTQNGEGGFSIPSGKTDQGLKVVEPVLMISHDINQNTNISASTGYDTWTAASDREFDVYSSASFAEEQKRTEYRGSVSVKDDLDQKGVSLSVSVSNEWDYKSKGVSLGLNHKFADDNVNLTLSTSIYRDLVSTYDYINEKTIEKRKKNSYIYQIGLSQFLTVNSLISFSIGSSNQKGAMEGALNSIDLNGIRVQDSLPGKRVKNWGAITYIHALPADSSIHLSGVAYKDSWDMKSYSLELSYFKELFEGDGLLNLFTRYYNQSEFNYFKKSFTSADVYMTSDSDYENFSSISAGFFYNHDFYFGDQVYHLTTGASHYRRSNDLHFSTIQTAVGITF